MRPSLDSAAAACVDAQAALEQALQAHLEAQRAERVARERAEAAGRALDRAAASRWLVENIAANPTPTGGHEEIYSDNKTRLITVLESRTEAGSLRLTHREWTHGRSGVRESRETVRVSPSSVSEYGRWRKNLNLS